MVLDFKLFLEVIRKRILMIMLLPIISAGLSILISFYFIEPKYESSATFYLINKKSGYAFPGEYGEMLLNRQLIRDYTKILKSKSNMESIINKYKLEKYTPAELAKRISISFTDDTNVIEIKAYSEFPELAKVIADAAYNIFVQNLAEFTEVFDVKLVDDAELPEKPSNSNVLVNTAIAFLAGVLISVSMAVFLEYIDHTIKTREDVETYLGLTVLGRIPVIERE
ncbi:MAG TPA: Wzz/FepE/Etk N-terminal domain-containing protein [Clostridiales bacterium]|nr:Wzz/FepE/Etk N-terminal domain-containing protein [Clostridiales bacterium]